jgi:hypothetical protein
VNAIMRLTARSIDLLSVTVVPSGVGCCGKSIAVGLVCVCVEQWP